jgi:hypothetical protein
MVKCTQITVEGQTQDKSKLEITAVDAPDAIIGETVEVNVTVSNTIVEGSGEELQGDILVSGVGYEATTTANLPPGASKQYFVNFVPEQVGEGEICAELI